MICKCKMGQCTLLNFYYTRISYRVTFWLFSPCSSHNSTCLTFLSSPALVEQVPLCGREATLQNFQNTFWRRLLLRHTQEILNTHRYQEVNQPQDLIIQEPPWSDLSAQITQIRSWGPFCHQSLLSWILWLASPTPIPPFPYLVVVIQSCTSGVNLAARSKVIMVILFLFSQFMSGNIHMPSDHPIRESPRLFLFYGRRRNNLYFLSFSVYWPKKSRYPGGS